MQWDYMIFSISSYPSWSDTGSIEVKNVSKQELIDLSNPGQNDNIFLELDSDGVDYSRMSERSSFSRLLIIIF